MNNNVYNTFPKSCYALNVLYICTEYEVFDCFGSISLFCGLYSLCASTSKVNTLKYATDNLLGKYLSH